jgi:hypothetical protein
MWHELISTMGTPTLVLVAAWRLPDWLSKWVDLRDRLHADADARPVESRRPDSNRGPLHYE